MRLHDLVATSGRLSRTSRRLDKIGRLSDLLRRLEPPEIPIGVAYLSGTLPQGRIGIGPAALRDGFPRSSAAAPTLTLTEVDETFERMASESGPGSGARRALLLQRLLLRASREEQDFLARLVLGELRQGSLQGLMVEAVARAAG
ncbi:MAG: ATP-dependent DNA ligase, partial [Acidobacteriota bacterium]